jgi:hypothetical protein
VQEFIVSRPNFLRPFLIPVSGIMIENGDTVFDAPVAMVSWIEDFRAGLLDATLLNSEVPTINPLVFPEAAIARDASVQDGQEFLVDQEAVQARQNNQTDEKPIIGFDLPVCDLPFPVLIETKSSAAETYIVCNLPPPLFQELKEVAPFDKIVCDLPFPLETPAETITKVEGAVKIDSADWYL